MFAVHLSPDADAFLDKLDKHIQERLKKRIARLGDTPVPADAKFIEHDSGGAMIFRYRIGDFRALYKVLHTEKSVLVIKIDKRSRVYDRQ